MWKGPSEEYIFALRDPIASRLARKPGERLIAFKIGEDERQAHVYRLEKIAPGNWRSVTLGYVQGGDVLNVYVNVALEYLPLDAELISLIGRHIERRAGWIDTALHGQMKSLEGIANTISDSLTTLRRRHVRA